MNKSKNVFFLIQSFSFYSNSFLTFIVFIWEKTISFFKIKNGEQYKEK